LSQRPSAAIVAVGNELLFGETVDTNAAWLGRTLTSWGFVVTRSFTVPDVAEAIREAVQRGLDEAALVIVTGGLGPTPDDLTKAAVAEHFGRGLVPEPTVLERIRARFRAAGYDRPPRLTEGQADVVAGATVLENTVGTAPGQLLEVDGRAVVLLPGVPREMKSIVEGPLLGHLRATGRLGTPVLHRQIFTTGIPESRLAEEVEPLWEGVDPLLREGVGFAFLPDELGVDIRLSAVGLEPREAERRFDRIEEALQPALAPWRFAAPSGDLAEAVAIVLRRVGWTMVSAESCTGGLVAARMTDHAGASDVFRGSVVAYDNAVKVGILGVDEAAIREQGAVSEVVAAAMVRGVVDRLGADVGVSITGVAGPTGGSEQKPVGTVWIGTAVAGEVRSTLHRFPGDRGSIRRRAAQAALAAVYRRLAERA